jgi:hypothetical protein
MFEMLLCLFQTAWKHFHPSGRNFLLDELFDGIWIVFC